jgi:aryl-alcohol dehydrogenase-like predicted oxidoreductase
VLAEIAAERDISIAQAAFAWVLGRRGVTSALAGVTTLEQLRGLIAATDVEFTAGELEMLERPGTTAARLRAWEAPMVNEAVEADEPETAEALQP